MISRPFHKYRHMYIHKLLWFQCYFHIMHINVGDLIGRQLILHNLTNATVHLYHEF